MKNLLLVSASVLLALLACLEPAGAATCHPDDQAGLLGFKAGITADPSGMLATWKAGTDCCAWDGVSCLDGKRVNAVWLSGDLSSPKAFLSGTISPALSKVSNLDGIHLFSMRNLSGPFPEVLFRLPALQSVYIERSGLSGPLPANLGALAKLSALGLTGNRFTGPIPSSISKLTNLGQLQLGNNRLTGPIPSAIKSLTGLINLNLEQNQLSGPIPDFLGSLPQLLFLTLSHNKLSGSIPASLSSLAPRLIFLELGHNALTGTIPAFLGNFKTLDTLDLSGNMLTGTVPKSFSNLTKIFNLDLSRNKLVDPFPALNVKGIESLDLSYNRFHLNTIPKWVTSSPIIFSLKLARCGIRMRLDDWKPAKTFFYHFIDLSENEIIGSPVRLLNSTEFLVSFRAKGNKLSFDFGRMKFPKTLRDLDLSGNSLTGKVPAGVAALKTLNVSSNRLCGPLPRTKFPASAFLKNACLCGAPLPPCKKA